MRKYLIILVIILCAFTAKSQQRFPSGFPTQANQGWNKWGYGMTDSGLIVANRDTNWLAKYSGTVVFKPSNKKFYWFDSTNLTWNQFADALDTTSLSNRINLKLNITDTTSKWWGIGKRWVDTVYRVNDSTIGFTINGGAQQTFEIKGGAAGGGGSGTVESVALSMPSAFTVTGSPITSSGTFAVSGAGTTLQYIRGNGTLATTDTGMIPNFYLKARGLISGTSPITFNQFTGAIGINNANTSGTKGAASFTAAFSDNGSGLIDLLDLVSAGSCTGCNLNIDAKGRITGYSDGAGGATNNTNIGAGFRILNAVTQEMRTIFVGGGMNIDSVSNTDGLTLSSENISNASLTADGDYTQNWNNKQWYVDSIAGQFLFRMGGVGSTGTRRKDFRINWGGSSFGDNLDGYNIMTTINKADNSGDSLRLGLISSGTGVLSMGYYDVTNSANNTFISYAQQTGLINISAKDSIWIKGAVPAATADSVLGLVNRGANGTGKLVKFPVPSGGGATASEGLIAVGSDIRLGNTDSSSTGQLSTNRFLYGTPGNKLDISRSWLEPDTTRRKITGRYNIDTIYYFGDSHTVGDLATTITRRFSTLTVEMLGYIERNFGVGGTTMIGNTSIITNLPSYSASTIGSYLVINFGTNDARFAAAGVPGFDTTAYKTAYSNWVDAAVAAGWPLDHIVIKQMEYSTESVSFSEFINFKNATRTVALVKGTLFDPTWDRMAADAASGFVASDGYHPNNNGHAFSAYSLISVIKGQVKNNNQVLAINGDSELETLFYKNADTAAYTSRAIGIDSLGKVVAFAPNWFIRNNTSLSELDAASFGITGMGYSQTAFRSTRLEIAGASSARDVGVPAIQAWVDGSNFAHIWAVNWATSGTMPLYLHEFGGTVQVGPGTLNSGARLSVGGNVIASGTVQGMAAFSGNSVGPSTQMYYAAAGYGGLQAYDNPNSLSKNLALQEFGGLTLIGTGTASGSAKLQVDGESYLKDKTVIGRMRTFQNQGIHGLSLLIDTATYIDNNTAISGTVAHVASNSILTPNLAAMSTGVTFTNASTLYIENAPTASTNLTISNPWALFINSGKTHLGTVDTGDNTDSILVLTAGYEIKKVAQSSISSGITSLNALTSATQTFATGTSGTDFNISSSTSTHTFNIPSASTSNRGLITTVSQTLGGTKTFNDGLVATSSSSARITINGNLSSASQVGIFGINFSLLPVTYTYTGAAGTETQGQMFSLFSAPTLSTSNAVTYTGTVASVNFSGAPIASGSATIDHPYNIYASDVSRFAGLALSLNEQSGDATIGTSSGVNIYTGAGGNTWTLPALDTHPGKFLFIKNAGGGNLTVQRAGSDNIYNTSSVTSITVAAGADVVLAAGSSFWYVIGF